MAEHVLSRLLKRATVADRASSDKARYLQTCRAARPGTWLFLSFLCVLGATTDYPRTYPRIFFSFAAVVLLESVLRGILVYSPWPLLFQTRNWEQAVAFLVLTSALSWGSFYGMTLFLYGPYSQASVLAMVCTVGTTTGAITAFGPNLHLSTTYLIALLAPSILVDLRIGGYSGISLAVITVVFLGFLLWQGKDLNRSYKRRTSTIRLLAKRRRELEERIAARTFELECAKESAESANRAKSDFLANVSHEIRTPMHGVLGMTALAMENANLPETQACLRDVKLSAESLLQVINDILDLSRMDAGKLTVEKEPFLLQDCINRSLQVLSLKAKEKSIQVHVYVDSLFSEAILGDTLRLQQILTNLIHNAIKFTDQGSISVSAKPETTFNVPVVHIAVEDTGCGIPEDQRRQVFEPFSQVDNSTTRKFGGAGLGLTICNQLVAQMNGRIWVEGNLLGGSTFHVTLPCQLATVQPEVSKAAHA